MYINPGYSSNGFRRLTSTSKSWREEQTGFRRISTGHWSDTNGWFMMTSPLLSSSTFAHPSCMNDNFSKSSRRFGLMSAVPLIRRYLRLTESPSQPLSHRWRNPPSQNRLHHL